MIAPSPGRANSSENNILILPPSVSIFCPPEVWPPGLAQESFTLWECQWRGKIRAYQEIEYAVYGFPIALKEQGLSAYLFYAGAKFERNGKIVDTFDNVRAAAAPVLAEGIEFVEPGRMQTRQA